MAPNPLRRSVEKAAVLTGLNLVVFGPPGQPLPAGLDRFPTRVAHTWLAIVLALLVAGHLGAAFGARFQEERP